MSELRSDVAHDPAGPTESPSCGGFVMFGSSADSMLYVGVDVRSIGVTYELGLLFVFARTPPALIAARRRQRRRRQRCNRIRRKLARRVGC